MLIRVNSFCIQCAKVYGGSRKELFNQILKEIKIKYFEDELNENQEEDYYPVGLAFGNCKILCFHFRVKFLGFLV